jgi:ubiquinone/menaquinone biosynthesis C-methylase UbiE
LKLLKLHRGEAQASYNDVAAVYDSFVKVWDRQIAAPALSYYNQLIGENVKPGAFVLDAGTGTGERTLALLAHS